MLLYLEIRISSRNSSNWFPYCDFPDIIMEIDYMFLNWEISTSSMNTSTDFTTVIYVYYHGNSLNVTVPGITHIISKTVDWFLYSEMCLLSWKLNTFLLYLEIRISSRNTSTDFPTVIYVYYLGNWLHVSQLGNSHIFYEFFHRFPYCDIRILSWKLTKWFSTWKYAYLSRNPYYRFPYCEIRILSWKLTTFFSTWKFAYLLGILPLISLPWYTCFILEIDYMFLYLEIRILSRNMSIDYHTLEYVYYHGNWLHFSPLGNTYIISDSVYRFLYS